MFAIEAPNASKVYKEAIDETVRRIEARGKESTKSAKVLLFKISEEKSPIFLEERSVGGATMNLSRVANMKADYVAESGSTSWYLWRNRSMLLTGSEPDKPTWGADIDGEYAAVVVGLSLKDCFLFASTLVREVNRKIVALNLQAV